MHGNRAAFSLSPVVSWLFPSIALGVGAALMFVEGAPSSRWAVQLASGALGLCAYASLRRVSWNRRRRLIGVGLCISLVFLTLGATGIDGVHRWLGAGPVMLHASMLVAPTLLVLAVELGSTAGLAALSTLQVVHLLQPDAGQATAVAAAAAVLFVVRRGRPTAMAAAACLVTAALTWIRADPLGPAPFVEDILGRALSRGAGWAALSTAALALFVASPVVGSEPPRAARFSLAAYFAASVLVSMVATFPTPLLGYSPSPIVGAFLGLAALSAAATR